MMDHFKEDIVSPRAKALSNVLYVLCWVFIVLFGGYALMMLQVVMLQFSVMALVTVLMAAAFAVLLFFLKDNLKVEYEYTFTNGSLDFAKVFRQAKRKELGSMNGADPLAERRLMRCLRSQDIEACGHVAGDSFRRYLAMKDVEKKNWFANRDGNLFYFYYVKESKKHMIIIEPSEEMVEMIRQYLPAGVYQG